jgi:hypothetical protein
MWVPFCYFPEIIFTVIRPARTTVAFVALVYSSKNVFAGTVSPTLSRCIASKLHRLVQTPQP